MREYLALLLAEARHEHFRAVFLDSGQRLLREEEMWSGSVDEVPIYPRLVIGRAIELGASGLILVHNHPSGDPSPSRADGEMTKAVASAGRVLGVRVIDHLIVSRHAVFSMRDAGML